MLIKLNQWINLNPMLEELSELFNTDGDLFDNEEEEEEGE